MHPETQLATRKQVLHSLGANAAETAALLFYNENHFVPPAETPVYPLPDELFVRAWRRYQREVEEAGTIEVLFPKFPQLQFAVLAGISTSAEYLAATCRGLVSQSAWNAGGLHLLEPETCRIVIHPTAAGHLPILVAGCRHDFVLLVQALTRKNETLPVPGSMGACLVSGYVNWDRIRALRSAFDVSPRGSSWPEAFAKIKADKPLYHDRFVLSSREAYSGVPAAALGLDALTWINLSEAIRLEHECTHYVTLRVFGSMRNNLLDELFADYFGIRAAIGFFRSDWLLHFWGLEAYPLYREGGRLENYRGSPPLSDGAFHLLQVLAKQAAENLEAFDRTLPEGADGLEFKGGLLNALACFSLEQVARPDFVPMFRIALERAAFRTLTSPSAPALGGN